MKTIFKNRALSASYILFLIATTILAVLSHYGYSISGSAISEQGAHETLSSWIMNSIMVLLAVTSVVAGWDYYEDFMFHRIILVLFGATVLMAVIFNPALSDSPVRNSSTYTAWYSYFLTTAALSFIILSFSTALILEKKRERVLTVAAAVSTLIISFLLPESERSGGLWQKVIFIIAFGWMVFTFNSKES